MVIKHVKSGTIEIVSDGPMTMLQFNCECMDALPYCKAMCCKSRLAFNTHLTPGEIAANKFTSTPGPNGLVVLETKNNGWECTYLEKSGHCEVHHDKPANCKNWHCSPGGPTEGITVREKGFYLIPTTV